VVPGHDDQALLVLTTVQPDHERKERRLLLVLQEHVHQVAQIPFHEAHSREHKVRELAQVKVVETADALLVVDDRHNEVIHE
jgi:hypothetical protein